MKLGIARALVTAALVLGLAQGAWGQSLLSRYPKSWGDFTVLSDQEFEAILRKPGAQVNRQKQSTGEGADPGAGFTQEAGDQPGAVSREGATGQTGTNLQPLEELFSMVEEGRGHSAYPLLLERYQRELDAAKEKGDDPEALNQRYLVALLRAGEELAPPEEVENLARLFTEKYPDNPAFPLAFFFLTQALFNQRKPLAESFFFDEKARSSLPPRMHTRFLRIMATVLLEKGDVEAAAEAMLQERNTGGTLHRTTEEEVVAVLTRVKSPEALEKFLTDHPSEDWLALHHPILRIWALINQQKLSAALLELDRIQKGEGDLTPVQVKALHETRLAIENRVLTQPGRIGVLLPLGSSSATLRNLSIEVLDGLRMAVQFSGSHQETLMEVLSRGMSQDLSPSLQQVRGTPSTPELQERVAVELVVKDSANNGALAAKMVEELVREEKVTAIIGPLAREESSEAAKRAEALGVPLISLSLTMDIPEEAQFVFRHNKDQEEEVRDLVRYARDYAGVIRFAVLYPDTGYGREVSQLFWDEVARQGGRVVGMEPYLPGMGSTGRSGQVVGFKELFERLTGQNRPVDPEELALMTKLDDDRPDPVVDFDALFIPVGPNGSQELRLIAPYPVTVDAEKVLLLGNRFWNTDGAMVASQGKLNGSVFVDAYNRGSSASAAREFRRRHLTMFGHRTSYASPSFFTALAYDTVGILRLLLQEPRNRTPLHMAEALAAMKPYPGITGLTTFDNTGAAVKESIFFTIQDDLIRKFIP